MPFGTKFKDMFVSDPVAATDGTLPVVALETVISLTALAIVDGKAISSFPLGSAIKLQIGRAHV